MKTCECGGPVARNARKCQTCGKRFTHPFVKVFAVLLVIAAIFAIVMQAKAATSDKATATVYVYRYRQMTGRAIRPTVYCDENKLAQMENGRYFAVKLMPGKHLFRANDKQSQIYIDAKPGVSYFIRVSNIWTTGGMLLLVAPEQGAAELASGKIKPLGQDKIFDHAAVSAGPVSFQPDTP